jgi:hypothetical protein
MGRGALSAEVQQRMSRAGISTGVTPQQADMQQRTSLRELDRFIKDQYRQAAQLNKAIDDRARQVERLRKLERESLDDEKRKLEIAKELARVEGQKQALERQHGQQMSGVKQALSQRGDLASGMEDPSTAMRLSRAFRMGRMGMWGGAGRQVSAAMGGGMGMGVGALGLLGSGLQMADPILRSLAAENRNYTYAQGSVVGGATGAGDIYGNKLASTMFFAPERQRAIGTALEKMQKTQFADKLAPFGTLAGNVAKGAAVGAAGGAFFGGVGAVPGAIGGGVLGGIKGGYDIATDQRTRLSFMSNLGSKDARKKLEAMQYSEMVSDFNSLVEAEKNKNPVKQMAEERFQQTRDRNLEMQRATGLTNRNFYGQGGALQTGYGAGFTEEQTTGAMQGILGAGGSTRGARGNNVLSNQMMKRMDVTNAAQLIGGLSGQLGGAAETRDATIKVLSEGMRLGLDKSEFAAEQRKFGELTVQAIQAAGATSLAGAGTAAGSFAAFNAGTTMQGIGAMSDAKAFFDQSTSQTGNPRGAIFASKIMGDSRLKKLSFDTQKVLSETPDSQLTEDNPFIQRAADEIGNGMTPTKMVEILKGHKSDSLIIRGGVEKVRRGLMNKYDKLRQSGKSEQEINEAIRNDPAFNQMLTGIGTEDTGFVGLSNEAKRSVGIKLIKGQLGGDEFKKEVEDRLKAQGGTGRIEDTSLEAVAVQQRIVNDQFLTMKDSMELAAESAKKMTAQTLEMHMRLSEAIGKGESLTPEQLKRILTPETAPRSGKVK